MDVFATVAVLLGLAALFSYLNEEFLHLEKTIGLMVLALALSALVWILSAVGVFDALDEQRELVSNLNLSETLLNGVLCFMLFAGCSGLK